MAAAHLAFGGLLVAILLAAGLADSAWASSSIREAFPATVLPQPPGP